MFPFFLSLCMFLKHLNHRNTRYTSVIHLTSLTSLKHPVLRCNFEHKVESTMDILSFPSSAQMCLFNDKLASNFHLSFSLSTNSITSFSSHSSGTECILRFSLCDLISKFDTDNEFIILIFCIFVSVASIHLVSIPQSLCNGTLFIS